MKIIVASVTSLVIGLLIGWYIEGNRAEREKTEIVEQMVDGIESSDRTDAARCVRVIEHIQSGDTQRAVQLLSGPIADFYSTYGNDQSNVRRSRVRAMIEQLSNSNAAVAARIAEAMTNGATKAQ